MCVAVPARIVEVSGTGVGRSGIVTNPDGSRSETDLTLLPDVEVGDFVIIHSGYAISTMALSEVEELHRLIEG